MRRSAPSLPSEIAATLKRVEHWRKTRTKRKPIPARLWEEAASLARSHGVHTVSRALRLNYNDLKKRASQLPQEYRHREAPPPSGFIELGATELASGSGSPETVVELSDGIGGQLRIRLSGQDRLDVTGLVRSFWSRPR